VDHYPQLSQCLYQDLVLCRVAGSSNDWLDKTELYKTRPRGMTRASVIHVPQDLSYSYAQSDSEEDDVD